MRLRVSGFVLVVLGQAVCVAVGLWLQHHILCASLRDTAEEQTFGLLESCADELHRAWPVDAPPTATALAGLTPAWRSAHPTPGVMLALVDERWCPLAPSAGAQPLNWEPRAGDMPASAALQRGTLHLPDGSHLAVAGALHGGARLLVHCPMAAATAAVTPITRQLLPIGGVTFLWTVALLSITVFLITARHRETLDQHRLRSTSDNIRQTQALIRTRDTVIFALAKLAGSRDHETGGHLERMSDYCVLLARALQSQPKYASQVDAAFVRLIGLSSILHDIGKVGIDDSVLRKPGPLTPAERAQMQRHTLIAGQCLDEIAQRLGSSNFLEMARQIARAHHEHWDGGGYPHGLRGTQIPLAARIVALADVYDALATPRVYKAPVPHEQCVATIQAQAGRQFDPDLVEVWLRLALQFQAIATTAPATAIGGHFIAASDPLPARPAAGAPPTACDSAAEPLVTRTGEPPC